MFPKSTKIKKKIPISEIKRLIKKYTPEQIECTPHTFFRLSRAQQEIFTCDELRRILTAQTPFLVGLQYNGDMQYFINIKRRI